MFDGRKRSYRYDYEPEWKRNLKFACIPLAVIILIAAIVLVERKASARREAIVAESVVAESAQQEETGELLQQPLQENAVPEIQELVARYQQAKVDSDATLMYEVYGRTDTDGLEELQSQLTGESGTYEEYQNTVCHTKPGLEADSYVVFVTADVKFRKADTAAPSFTWCYVKKNADGTYVMVEQDKLDAQTSSYIEEVTQTDEVRLLATEMNAKLEDAVSADAKLAAIYQKLVNPDAVSGNSLSDLAESAAAAVATESAEETTADITEESSVAESSAVTQ